MIKITTSTVVVRQAALVLSLFLTGCYIERDVNPAKPWQAKAQQKTFDVEIPFSSMNASIGQHAQLLLKKSIDQAASETTDYVHAQIKVRHLYKRFDDPSTDPRIKKVIKLLKKYGLTEERIEVSEDPDLKLSSLTGKTGVWVGIDYYQIKPLKCPGFDRQVMNGRVPPEGESHFGCTTESNFAAMIAEPRDLHHGQRLKDNDPILSSNAIERLRTDKVKALKVEKIETSSGTSSGG